jgi:hypothetical protein
MIGFCNSDSKPNLLVIAAIERDTPTVEETLHGIANLMLHRRAVFTVQ